MANRNPTVNWGKEKCAHCGGTGEVWSTQSAEPAAKLPAMQDKPDCPHCDGTGRSRQSIPVDELNASNDD
jgi:hypothetical protein